MKGVGVKIQKIREKRKLSVDDLAFELHVTRQTIIDYESGYKIPSLEHVSEISKILRVTTDFLLDDSRTMDQIKTRKSEEKVVLKSENRKEQKISTDGYHPSTTKSNNKKGKKLIISGIVILVIWFLLNVFTGVLRLSLFQHMSLESDFNTISLITSVFPLLSFLSILLFLVGISLLLIGLLFLISSSSTEQTDHNVYCPNCGNKIEKTTNYCARCGHQFKQPTSY
jgi:transcriptional regulator with XRE-family HTH domain/DNA-directed RNA polymerase subunit RPC12/RpoP